MTNRSTIATVFAGQSLVTVIAALAWLLAAGSGSGLAALAGGGIAILPGAYFAVKVFSVPAGAPPKQLLNAFYRGEALKFVITVVLFIIALQWFADSFLPLLTTYIAALLVYWLALRVGVGIQR
ncbi:MAG: ATP synthase subunit I [Ectothiorhodospiraceae bacterium]|nr:ATP synthase subunit I [Ectothiorhodospiraceae bacterium]